MNKLFKSDYLKAVSEWKSKQSQLIFKKDDLGFDYLVAYDGEIEFFFYPKDENIKKFFPKLRLFYDSKQKKITKIVCNKCGEQKCSHFYSVLLYAYTFLNENVIEKKEEVRVYDNYFFALNDIFADLQIYLRGLLNEESETFSVILKGLANVDIKQIIVDFQGSFTDKDVSGKKKNANKNELFLLLLWKYKIKYFSIRKTFIFWKKDFAKIVPVLKLFEDKIFLYENKEKMEFLHEKKTLNFLLKKIKEDEFSLAIKSNFLYDDIYFSSDVCFVCKNKILNIDLPFDEKVLEKLFLGNLKFKMVDLVYLKEVIFPKLELLGHEINIEKNVIFPEIFNLHTANLIKIEEKDEEKYLIEIFLQFENKYFPLRLVNGKAELYYYKASWFHIKKQFLKKIKEFCLLFKKGIEEDISFQKNKFETFKKIIYKKYNDSFWIFEFPDGTNEDFVQKINLIPEIDVDAKDGWFEYVINYKLIDKEFLSLKDLEVFFNSKEKFLKLKNGKILFVENKDELLQMNNYFKFYEKENFYKLRSFEIPKFYSFFSKYRVNIKNDEKIFQINTALQNRSLPNEKSLPEHLNKSMRLYQKEGFAWLEMLKHFHFNGILADEMGLGKTVQALSVLTANLNDKINLIVCPKTLIFVWANEIKKFSPNLKYLIYDGDKIVRKEKNDFEKYEAIIVSYSILMKDLDYFKKFSYNYVVIDEAQYIKNHKTIRANAVNSIQAEHKIALSGTPIENSPEDIWSIFNFLMPSFFPPHREFKNKLKKDKDYLNNVKTMISPYLLRRKKEQILKELPAKQEQIILSKMSFLQNFYYTKILKEIKESIANKKWNYLNVLSALTKLRQICNHPYLIDKNVKKNIHNSGKTSLLLELILNLLENNKKILVFSQFLKMLEIIKDELQSLKINFSYLDGKTKNRQQVIEEFNQNEDIKVFLISLKTGNFGINLTSADTVILVDPWWNPMVENQAIDRAHRIGQSKKLLVYKLISKGTVEEKIYNMQKEKKHLFNNLIENMDSELKNFSLQEIMNLFEE